MADAYWRHGDGRQLSIPATALLAPVAKRPRPDYAVADVTAGHEVTYLYPNEDERGVHRVVRDMDPIGASYDNYLRSTQMSGYAKNEPTRSLSGGLIGRPVDDPHVLGVGTSDPVIASKIRGMGVGGGRPEVPLPPDASSTLYVEGLPANCTRREVSHIFRPFVGYKEVRLVNKESRHSGGEPLVLCFVDFISPAHAATAMDALQGYKFDETERESPRLRLQFARYPGARSGGRHQGKR